MSNVAGIVPGIVVPNYGHDLSCITDLDPAMLEVDGLTLLAQALARRIITPRGQLIDDPNYGFDITDYLNDDLSPADLARIGSQVDAEFVKDERVLRSSSTVTLAATIFTVQSNIVPSAQSAFRLVLAIGNVTTQILAVTS